MLGVLELLGIKSGGFFVMVSGRQEIMVPCRRCGTPTVELNFADRAKQLCARCVSDVPNQMSLFPKHMIPRLEKKRNLEIKELYSRCESCMRAYRSFIMFAWGWLPEDSLKVLAMIFLGQRIINTAKEPFSAGMCAGHMPQGVYLKWLEEWSNGKQMQGMQGQR